jgi:hypothetical protein
MLTYNGSSISVAYSFYTDTVVDLTLTANTMRLKSFFCIAAVSMVAGKCVNLMALLIYSHVKYMYLPDVIYTEMT